MTPRPAPKLPQLTRLTQAVLLRLGPGACLDQAALLWKPHPGDVTAQPSDQVIDTLSKRRNLYGTALLASTTTQPELLREHPDHDKARVQRALALNPHLTLEHARELAAHATRTRDTPLVLSLIKRSPYFAALLCEYPESLRQLSVRTGQPGPRTLGARLNDLEPHEVPALTTTFYPSGYRTAFARQSPEAVLSLAVDSYIALLTRDQVTPHVPTLAAMAESLMPAALGRPHTRPRLPSALAGPIAELPGRDVLTLSQTFAIDPDDHLKDAPGLERASGATLERVLSYPHRPSDPPLDRAINHWSPTALAVAASWVAPQLHTFAQLEAFNTLTRGWSDNLRKLTQVAVAL